MSGGMIQNTIRQLCIGVFVCAMLITVNAYGAQAAAKTAAKASPVASAVKPTDAKSAAKTANLATPTAAKQQSKALTPPPMVGAQTVVAPDTAKSLVPDKSKLIESAQSFTDALKSQKNVHASKSDKKAAPKKKVVKARKHVVDAKVLVWGKSAEESEASAIDASRKLVGSKDNYLIKDTSFLVDNSKIVCMMRINFTDEIPETWYLETEMVTGFGKTREKAYADALVKAIGKAKIVQNTGDWINTQSTAKNSTDMGVIPYEYAFASLNKEVYCKLYFRYFMPR